MRSCLKLLRGKNVEKLKSRKQVKEYINKVRDTPNYIEGAASLSLFSMEPTIIILKELFGGRCDYIDVDYHGNILSGRPIHLTEEEKASLFNFKDLLGILGVYILLAVKGEVVGSGEPKVSELHKLFNGLESNGFKGLSYELLEMPDFISDLKEDSFLDCRCKKLILNTSLIGKVVRAGLDIEEIELKKPASIWLDKYIDKSSGYVEYRNLYRKGEHLRVYADKLTLYYHREERDYLNQFKYRKFYNDSDELAKCLLLGWFNVVVLSDVNIGHI